MDELAIQAVSVLMLTWLLIGGAAGFLVGRSTAGYQPGSLLEDWREPDGELDAVDLEALETECEELVAPAREQQILGTASQVNLREHASDLRRAAKTIRGHPHGPREEALAQRLEETADRLENGEDGSSALDEPPADYPGMKMP